MSSRGRERFMLSKSLKIVPKRARNCWVNHQIYQRARPHTMSAASLEGNNCMELKARSWFYHHHLLLSLKALSLMSKLESEVLRGQSTQSEYLLERFRWRTTQFRWVSVIGTTQSKMKWASKTTLSRMWLAFRITQSKTGWVNTTIRCKWESASMTILSKWELVTEITLYRWCRLILKTSQFKWRLRKRALTCKPLSTSSLTLLSKLKPGLRHLKR